MAKDERGKPGTGRIRRNISPRIAGSFDGNSDADYSTETILEDSEQTDEPMMLPPTVSTYSHRTPYIPPPPDVQTLRNDLVGALAEARKAMAQVSEQNQISGKSVDNEQDHASCRELQYPEADGGIPSAQPSGWFEIQGLHVLDVVTLAIRAAKIYYTSHEDPMRLYGIKSERQIREELLGVMDVLKKMAGRNFAGGMRGEELSIVSSWLEGIERFLAQEQELESKEVNKRASWDWLEGSWTGRERQRERSFLNSFQNGEALPEWTCNDPNQPIVTPFLEALRTGLILVHLHNALLKKSKRQFGEIKTFHTDLAKPYRCAENLRYWIKAAELRWETKLKVNVSGVVNGRIEAYPEFDAAILQWSQAVREELTKEWREASNKPIAAQGPMPTG